TRRSPSRGSAYSACDGRPLPPLGPRRHEHLARGVARRAPPADPGRDTGDLVRGRRERSLRWDRAVPGRGRGRRPAARPAPRAARQGAGRVRALRRRHVSALRVERDGPLLRVAMARPERRNAFDASLIDELAAAFADVGDARAVILSGEGPSFSAGADVEWMRA